MCPALMFAASRNESVNGRTRTLVVSIIIRKGFSQSGAPSGKRCAIDAFTFFVNEEMIKDNQRGIPRAKVIIRWLDSLNVYGFNPIKLIKIIAGKIIEINVEEPFILLVNVRESWIYIKAYIIKYIMLSRDTLFQKDNCIIKITSKLEIKIMLIDELIDVKEEGSNDEKISIIIKTWLYHLGLWRHLV